MPKHRVNRPLSRKSALFTVALLLGLLQLGSLAPRAQQAQPAKQGQQGQQGQQAQPADAQQADTQQPVFRGGINFVRVDVIVTDKKGQQVTDLKQSDFDVTEDKKPQTVEQFRLIRVDGNPRPGEPPPRQIRDSDDAAVEMAKDDVRVFVIFFDDYHVRLGNSLSVKEPLSRFVREQLRPNDIVGIMYPLTPVNDIDFTRNQSSILSAINNFTGRKFDYTPRNQFEEQYARYPTETVEQVRNDVVMTALRGLSTRLGGLREARKSIIYVSEGLTASLPPQMRRADATTPQDPRYTGAALGENSHQQQTAEFFNQSDLYSRLLDGLAPPHPKKYP
jgi:VWFA-related protein